MTTYEGSCHCGAVRFRLRADPIGAGVRCNCSICIRRGAVMSTRYFSPDEFDLVAGADVLVLYQFGDRLVNHYFCPHCGVYPFHDAVETPGHYRVNLACVEGLDPLALDIEWIDGRSF